MTIGCIESFHKCVGDCIKVEASKLGKSTNWDDKEGWCREDEMGSVKARVGRKVKVVLAKVKVVG